MVVVALLSVYLVESVYVVSVYLVVNCTVHSRAAKNFWSLNFQTPSLSLPQNVTAYQCLGL